MRHVSEHAEGGVVYPAIGERHLSISVDAFIRIDTDEDRPPAILYRLRMQKVDLRDSHCCSFGLACFCHASMRRQLGRNQ